MGSDNFRPKAILRGAGFPDAARIAAVLKDPDPMAPRDKPEGAGPGDANILSLDQSITLFV